MKNRLQYRLTEIQKQRREEHKRLRLRSFLGISVSFLVLYSLLLPAFTLEKPTYCGFEEHTHSEECYEYYLDCSVTGEKHGPLTIEELTALTAAGIRLSDIRAEGEAPQEEGELYHSEDTAGEEAGETVVSKADKPKKNKDTEPGTAKDIASPSDYTEHNDEPARQPLTSDGSGEFLSNVENAGEASYAVVNRDGAVESTEEAGESQDIFMSTDIRYAGIPGEEDPEDPDAVTESSKEDAEPESYAVVSDDEHMIVNSDELGDPAEDEPDPGVEDADIFTESEAGTEDDHKDNADPEPVSTDVSIAEIETPEAGTIQSDTADPNTDGINAETVNTETINNDPEDTEVLSTESSDTENPDVNSIDTEIVNPDAVTANDPAESESATPAENQTGETGSDTVKTGENIPAAEEAVIAAEEITPAENDITPTIEETTSAEETTAPAAAPHIHTAACYKKLAVCGMEEHEHSLSCYSDPSADVEDDALIEDLFPTFEEEKVKDSYEYAAKLAGFQKGYHESVNNYMILVDENDEETIQGYTRYGAWAGDDYAVNWNPLFTAFTAEYAGLDIETFDKEGMMSVYDWMQLLREKSLEEEIPEYLSDAFIGTDVLLQLREIALEYFEAGNYDALRGVPEDPALKTMLINALSAARRYNENSFRDVESYIDLIYSDYLIEDEEGNELLSLEYYADGHPAAPAIGELVFLDLVGDDFEADHVGIITAVNLSKNRMTVMIGDLDDRVREEKFEFDQMEVLGFACLPETEEALQRNYEALTGKDPTLEFGEFGEIELESQADEEETAESEVEVEALYMNDVLTIEGTDYTVNLQVGEDAGIPEGAEVTVEEITEGSPEYQTYYNEALAGGEEGSSISFARFFDITFTFEDEEIEPLAPVAVSISYDAGVVPEEGTKKAVHFNGVTGQMEVLEVSETVTDTVEENIPELKAEEPASLDEPAEEENDTESDNIYVNDEEDLFKALEAASEAAIETGSQSKPVDLSQDEAFAAAKAHNEEPMFFSGVRKLGKTLTSFIVKDTVDLETEMGMTDNAENSMETDDAAFTASAVEETDTELKATQKPERKQPRKTNPKVSEIKKHSAGRETFSFVQGSFSVTGTIVYTVDFYNEVTNEIYALSIRGGDGIRLSELVEVLGLAKLTKENGIKQTNATSGDFTEEKKSEEETLHTAAPGIFTGNNIPVSEESMAFVAQIEQAVFSSPELLSVSKAGKDTTIGEIRTALGLECTYSAILTEADIKVINEKQVREGDWALISVLPFDTEETLTLTMYNGDVYEIVVKDAQEISDVSTVDVNKSYIICTVTEDGKYQVLKTDGNYETFENTSGFDKLDNNYKWIFYYIFTEKDRESTKDYTYYFIRPFDDKTRTIALNDPTSANNPLVQKGTNNVAIVPQTGGGFVFLGYNFSAEKHIELGFKEGGFVAYNDTAFDNPDDDPTIIRIFEQEPLETYDFTVISADETMGSVTVAGKVPQTAEIQVEEETDDGDIQTVTKTITYYIAETNNDKKNSSLISAAPVYQYENNKKYLFDHWELNGEILYQKDGDGNPVLDGQGNPVPVGDTFAADTLEIPYNSSVLRAFFKRNPDYQVVDDDEKQGHSIGRKEILDWLNELKSRNTPLNNEGCEKTAEVYDYENRIYRVDMTAQANLVTFDGTIDLGFILDVSGSMNFPSYLYDSDDVANHEAKKISEINSNNNAYRWGLKTDKTYYIIADPNGTATVCYLYYYGNQWWLCDSSKNRFDGSNGRFDPATGWSVNGGQNYGASYYSTSATYVIKEAGDLVKQEDLDDQNTGALLEKLGINQVGTPKTRAYYLEKSLNNTINELNEILKILAIADERQSPGGNPDVKIAWNTFKNFLPAESNQHQYEFVSAKNGITLNYDKNTYGGGTSTDMALLDAAGMRRYDVAADDNVNSSDKGVYGSWLRRLRENNGQYSQKGLEYINNRNNGNAYVSYSNQNKGFQWEDSATKYAVLITDGAPQRAGESIDSELVKDAASELKKKGVELITVGLGMRDVVEGRKLLFDIADQGADNYPMFYSANRGDELEYVLYDIIKKIMTEAVVQGDVIDTVGEAFYPVDKATGKPILPEAGTCRYIDLEGNLLTDAGGNPLTTAPVDIPYGIIEPDEGSYKVTWPNQDIRSFEPYWHGTIYVKAKEDLLGGNAVLTNKGEATVEAKTYRVKDGEAIYVLKESRQGIIDSGGHIIVDDKGNPVGPYSWYRALESPRVNVNELAFDGNETSWTVYLGTEVNPKEELIELYNNIKVSEVVTAANDRNQDGLPDTITSDNHFYPLIESFADDREKDGTGEKVTFYLKDLIRIIAEKAPVGNRYPWWNYTDHEPNWPVFFEAALTSDGIVIPYHEYGIEDSSNIRITLEKTIINGEERNLYVWDDGTQTYIAKSPHATTVVNGTADDGTGNPVDVPVEKYDLTIVYSPDYDVLPKGQGGGSETDFHVGTYGTIYQGHAAGTETSRNNHIINVYAKKLAINKVDQSGNTITSSKAEFNLYRKATDEDDPAVYVPAGGIPSCLPKTERVDGAERAVNYVLVETLSTEHEIDSSSVVTGRFITSDLNGAYEYYLVEMKSPDGYSMPSGYFKVAVDKESSYELKFGEAHQQSDENLSLRSDWEEKSTVLVTSVGEGMENYATYSGNTGAGGARTKDTEPEEVPFKILNNAGYELPSTGGIGTDLFRALGLLLMLVALGLDWAILRRNQIC